MYYEIDVQQKWQLISYKLIEHNYEFNVSRIYEFDNLDRDTFCYTIKELIKHHESLRTCFSEVNGIIKHKIYKPNEVEPDTELIDISENDEEKLNKLLNIHRRFFFDLEKVPLFKIKIFRTNGKSVCLFIMSHVIGDDVSFNIIERDFKTIYLSIEKGEKVDLLGRKKQLKDYFEWKKSQIHSEIGKKALNFWRTKISQSSTSIQNKDKLTTFFKDKLAFFF